MFLYIKIGSVTIIRMDNPRPGDGCGYMIKVRKEESEAVHILQNNGIRILGVVDE